jgi:hypothetical protein
MLYLAAVLAISNDGNLLPHPVQVPAVTLGVPSAPTSSSISRIRGADALPREQAGPAEQPGAVDRQREFRRAAI